MASSVSANANIQAQAQQYMQQPDFKPSYNAVQLNLSQPTLNAAPLMQPALPATATQQWIA